MQLCCLNRLLLTDAKTRTLLQQFCTSKPTSLSHVEFATLCTALATQCAPLQVILQELYQEELQKRGHLPVFYYCFPGIWKPFLCALASTASAVWPVRLDTIPTILHIIETKTYTAQCHVFLQPFCPTLCQVLMHYEDVSDNIVALLQAIVDVVQHTYPALSFFSAAPPDTSDVPVHLCHSTPLSGSTSEFVKHLHKVHNLIQKKATPTAINLTFADLLLKGYMILPEPTPQLSGTVWSFPKLRSLPRFIGVDPAATQAQWADTNISTAEAELLCNKKETSGYAAKKHTAGLFVSTCLKNP